MFGNNVTSSWANPQQNQQQTQQQQQTGAFGQPSAFGTSGGFGQNQQTQPQANPMFGNLGSTPSTGTAGFGAFGNTNPAPQPSAFGATKPATGFGAFGGGSSAFGGGGGGGGGGAFGQSSNTTGATGTTSIFGHPSTTNTAGAFSSGTGLFGNKPTTNAFAPTTTTTTSAPVVTTGSSNPPYSTFTEKDTASSITLQYQAISCMPAYSGTSFEELRLQDYAQGRKTAGAFGQSAAFGTTPQNNTGIFGTQPTQQNPQPSIFGGGATNSTTTTSGFGGFGTTPVTNQGAAAPVSTGIFGNTTFGQQQPQQQTQGFGTFSASTQPQQQAGSLFGNTFGNNAPKPAFPAFGGSGSTTFGAGGAFGQQNQQQQQSAGSLFGNPAPAANATGFGVFGPNTNGTNKSIFGNPQPSAPQPVTTGAFGVFGNQQNQQGQQPQGQQPSIFGTGSLFSNNQQQQPQQNAQQPPATSLFGNTPAQPAGSGLFNNSLFNNANQQQQQQQNSGFSLFSAKPAAPATQGLFSGGFNQQQPTNNTPQPNVFGGPPGQSTNQQSVLGAGGIFGNGRPAAPMLSTSTLNGQGGLFNSNGMFNASTSGSNAQGTLTASISEPIGSNLPIFKLLPPGPQLVSLENSQAKKKAGFFVDVPTRSPIPRVQLGYTPANSKLRGFGSSTWGPPTAGGNPFASLSFSSGKLNALSLIRASENKPSIGSNTLTGRNSSPALGSGIRQSVKKVILDKKVEPSELFIKSGGSPGSLRGGKVVFSPALSVAAREKDAAAALTSSRPTESPTPASRTRRSPNRFTAQSTQNVLQTDKPEDSESTAVEEGDYWVKPDLPVLKHAGYDQLSSFKDLVVGRVGYGEIHFLEPVDLTGLPKLGALLGEVVRFDDKECSVYPDSEEVDKPPPGSGLNVRARLSLLRCWAVDKATREPIKDPSHPVAVKHLKRLKNMKETHFESFDISEGKWTFTVDHF